MAYKSKCLDKRTFHCRREYLHSQFRDGSDIFLNWKFCKGDPETTWKHGIGKNFAPKYGISAVALGKVCDKLQIPYRDPVYSEAAK